MSTWPSAANAYRNARTIFKARLREAAKNAKKFFVITIAHIHRPIYQALARLIVQYARQR